MSDFPKKVHIREEGPREGFQIEPGPISTDDKVKLIDALSETGVEHIQVASFVSKNAVPGWSDADEVVSKFKNKSNVEYTALFFNEKGLDRALKFKDKLKVEGAISVSASEKFSLINLRRSRSEDEDYLKKQIELFKKNDIFVERLSVMAAFGCNYSGEINSKDVVESINKSLMCSEDFGFSIKKITLGDSMGWCTPNRVKHLVGSIREKWPELKIIMHLHDTRGMGIASAYASMEMGIDMFDSTVAGLGGCPFAGLPGATGNISTEELVLLCHSMGIETGIDLDKLIEVARLAEKIVGHQLPSPLIRSGSYKTFTN